MGHKKLKEAMYCLAKAPRNCLLPESHFTAIPHFVNSVNSVQKPSNPPEPNFPQKQLTQGQARTPYGRNPRMDTKMN